MQQYVIRRLLLMIPTIIGVTIIVSGIVRLLPGDAVDILAEQFQGTVEEQESYETELRKELRLDRSWPEQYGDWVWNVARGKLGTSLYGNERDVWSDLRPRIAVTVELALLGLLIGTTIAIPLGIFSALKRNTIADYGIRSLAIAFLAVPTFWLATIVIAIIIPKLGLSPLPIRYHGLFENPIENIKQLWVPSMILGLALAGIVMRITRSQILEALQQDYVRTASSKGLRKFTVINRHVMKNALIPIITIIGVQISLVISGSVVLETIFVLPGLGLRLIRALGERDIPVILGINLFVAIFVILANLFIDIAYSALYPRLKLSRKI